MGSEVGVGGVAVIRTYRVVYFNSCYYILSPWCKVDPLRACYLPL